MPGREDRQGVPNDSKVHGESIAQKCIQIE
jgi:hypothetical protein